MDWQTVKDLREQLNALRIPNKEGESPNISTPMQAKVFGNIGYLLTTMDSTELQFVREALTPEGIEQEDPEVYQNLANAISRLQEYVADIERKDKEEQNRARIEQTLNALANSLENLSLDKSTVQELRKTLNTTAELLRK